MNVPQQFLIRIRPWRTNICKTSN